MSNCPYNDEVPDLPKVSRLFSWLYTYTLAPFFFQWKYQRNPTCEYAEVSKGGKVFVNAYLG